MSDEQAASLETDRDSPSPPALGLSLHDQALRHPTAAGELAQLDRVLRLALPLIWKSPGDAPSVLAQLTEVELTFLDDDAIAAVHGDFLDDPTPTDVITFHHGEILISSETAAREAAARNLPPAREIALYAIHGLLHLHGHTDAASSARAVMQATQERILEAVWPKMTMITLLLATHNAHKTSEVRAILGPGIEISDLTTWPGAPEPEETGSTFAENACIKALAASALAGPGVWVLADDSGLEVDALGGSPGVHSARFSGRHGDNAGHRAKLLDELLRVGADQPDNRRARFRCVLALARAGRVVAEFEGAVEGRIAESEEGTGGFGYDPIFVPAGETSTFGVLPDAVKNTFSHRARALAALAASGHLASE